VSAPVRVDVSEDVAALGYTGQRKVTEDAAGNVYVGYRKKWNGKHEVFVAKVTYAGGRAEVSGTDRPVAPAGSGTDQRVPSLALGPDGRLHVVWYGSDSEDEENDRQVKYAFSDDGGRSWTARGNIAPVEGYDGEELWQEHPSVFVDGRGVVFVTWEGKDLDHARQQVKMVRSSDGGRTWSGWTNVAPTPDRTQSRPGLVEDADGSLRLFMYSSAVPDGPQQVQESVSRDGGASWSGWRALSDPSLDSRHVGAVADDRGRLFAVWRAGQAGGRPANVYFSTFENGAWSPPAAVAPAADRFQFFPSVGIDGSGNVWAVWNETPSASGFPRERPENGTIRAAVFSDREKRFVPAGTSPAGVYPLLPSRSKAIGGIPAVYMQVGSMREFPIWLFALRKQ
jgi:hypothetical protein